MFSQCFGDSREFNAEIDYVSSLSFDRSGCYLATGDNAGRVVLFNRVGSTPPGRRRSSAGASKGTVDASSCPLCASATSSSSSSSSGSTSSEASSIDEFKSSFGGFGSKYAELDMPTLYSSSCSSCKCEIFGDSSTASSSSNSGSNSQEWTVYHQFQSHEVEFDYLKSLEINQRINCIEWCTQSCPQKISLLSANDKCVKLWSISERIMEDTNASSGAKHAYIRNGELHIRAPNSGNFHYDSKSAYGYSSTEYSSRKTSASHKSESNRRIYNDAHAYHINSLSANSDCETFISADDLRINWWNLEYPDQCFTVVDTKPANMDDLSEVITAAKCHPSQCYTIAYATSKGVVKLLDTRKSTLCDDPVAVLQGHDASSIGAFSQYDLFGASNNSFFSEMLEAISDFTFTNDGRYIYVRDFMTIKMYDIAMPQRGPISTIPVHSHLSPYVWELYENDFLFDKFRLAASSNGAFVMTGSYGNKATVINTLDGCAVAAMSLPMPPRATSDANRTASSASSSSSGSSNSSSGSNSNSGSNAVPSWGELDKIKPDRKVLHCAWGPGSSDSGNVMAIAAQACLYLYRL